MSAHGEKKELEARVIEVLRTIYDPEIPVDIYELGLIYEVKVNDDMSVDVLMTLTSPACPVAESMPAEVETKVGQTHGVTGSKVNLTFEPAWNKDMMSEAAQLELGLL
jgi:FeS assembly SUF system protein